MKQEMNQQSAMDSTVKAFRKKRYAKPVLIRYGDIRTRTLAPTPEPQFETGRGAGYRANL